MLADGINHAVPSHKELQQSLRWLADRNLIIKDSNRYSLSESGKRIFDNAKSKSNLRQRWKEIEIEINNLH
jgi:predicted transcriptional regulator